LYLAGPSFLRWNFGLIVNWHRNNKLSLATQPKRTSTMRTHPPFRTRLIVCLFAIICINMCVQSAEDVTRTNAIEASTTKQIYYPYWIYDGAAGKYITQTAADYDKPDSRFSTTRMKQTDNCVIFWEAGYGDNPETAPVGYKVALTGILAELESLYAFYRDDLAFVQKIHLLPINIKWSPFCFTTKIGERFMAPVQMIKWGWCCCILPASNRPRTVHWPMSWDIRFNTWWALTGKLASRARHGK